MTYLNGLSYATMAQTHGSKEPILGSKVGASTQGTMCSWRGTMSGHYWHIFTAWTFATIPMLSLASAFVVALEASKPRSPPGSFYTDTQHNNRSLGLAFYSGIPSTQLTFIASFSSTLATALLPASMVLFSYTTALTMTRDSDKENHQHLPSPYQLELLISTLNGSLLTFWSFATYVLGRKGQRVTVISQLWRVTSLFGAMATLAYQD